MATNYWAKYYLDYNKFQASDNDKNNKKYQVEPVANSNSQVEVTSQNSNNNTFDLVILSPAPNVALSGIVDLSVNVFNCPNLKNIVFVLNNQQISEFTQRPYLSKYDTTVLPDGDYAFEAKATTQDGIAISQSTVLSIKNAILDTDNPTVSFVLPDSRPFVWVGTSDLDIEVRSTDNRVVKRLELYIDKNLVFPTKTNQISGNANSAQVRVRWPAAGVDQGDYVLRAKAYDMAGNMSQESLRVVRSSYNSK